MIITDHIVGRLGTLIDAPVGLTTVVDLPAELINAEPEMAHMTPGIAHASRWIPNCSDRAGLLHCSSNRGRFARLALLYGWTHAQDHQFIYEHAAPRCVHSVDHGHFFPGSIDWTVETLSRAPAVVPDPGIVSGCGLTDADLNSARQDMRNPRDGELATIVAQPPEEWGFSDDERCAVASYLAAGRDVIFGVLEGGEPQ
jgi:hypothetical protein